jgi:hypothetical protein
MTGDAYPPERRRDIGRRAIDQGRAFTHVYAWPHWVEPLLTAITIVTALARGLDYVAARPGEPCCSLEYLGIVGIHRWGLAYLVVAALVAVGVLLRMATGKAWLQISAHGVAQAVYGAFGMALLQGIFTTGGGVGMRGLAYAISGGAMHFVIMVVLVTRCRTL